MQHSFTSHSFVVVSADSLVKQDQLQQLFPPPCLCLTSQPHFIRALEHFKTRVEQTNSHLSVHKTGGFLNSNSQFSTILPSSLGYLNFVSEGIRQMTAFQLFEWIFEHFLMFLPFFCVIRAAFDALRLKSKKKES